MDPFSVIPHLENSAVTYVQAQTISLPYNFVPYEFTSASGPELEVSFLDVGFINHIGSTALTLYGLLAEYHIFSIFMVILLAVGVLFWIWRIVTELPSNVAINASGAIDAGAVAYGNLRGREINQLYDEEVEPFVTGYNEAVAGKEEYETLLSEIRGNSKTPKAALKYTRQKISDYRGQAAAYKDEIDWVTSQRRGELSRVRQQIRSVKSVWGAYRRFRR